MVVFLGFGTGDRLRIEGVGHLVSGEWQYIMEN